MTVPWHTLPPPAVQLVCDDKDPRLLRWHCASPLTLDSCPRRSWSMTLVITSILPILIASQAVLTKLNFGAAALPCWGWQQQSLRTGSFC